MSEKSLVLSVTYRRESRPDRRPCFILHISYCTIKHTFTSSLWLPGFLQMFYRMIQPLCNPPSFSLLANLVNSQLSCDLVKSLPLFSFPATYCQAQHTSSFLDILTQTLTLDSLFHLFRVRTQLWSRFWVRFMERGRWFLRVLSGKCNFLF